MAPVEVEKEASPAPVPAPVLAIAITGSTEERVGLLRDALVK